MDKAALRRQLEETGPPPADIADKVIQHLRDWLAGRLPGTIAAYLSMRDEIDVSPLFGWLPGWQWVLPRVEDDGGISFRDRDVPTERHALGMLQPVDAGAIVRVNQIDIFLVPGLAFDRGGGRLGRGGGYYDRILGDARSDRVAVGVTTESRLIERVPMDQRDVRVGWLATEAGVSRCRPTI